MLKVLKLICSLAKQLDEHLTRGVDRHGRRLAGLRPAGAKRRTGRSAAQKPVRPKGYSAASAA